MKVLQIIRKSSSFCTALVAVLIPSLVIWPVAADPSGASVVAGAISFNGLGTGNLTINQTSSAAIINWQDFSINHGERTHFNQIVGGVALNRVTGGNISSIYGTLSATGTVILINPNGIIQGPSGVIDVAGMLTLSTLDIDDNDFLNGGSNRFYGNSNAGITTYGRVRAGSDAFFLGGFAHNFGSIESTAGTVAMGSGNDIIVDRSGSSIISIRGASSYEGIGVDNRGTVAGAAVELQASGNPYSLAINNDGIIRATGGAKIGGRSKLFATGSRINNTGTIAARQANGAGGDIEITGGQVVNSGTLDASSIGTNNGGNVKVTGASLTFTDDSNIMVNSPGGNAGKVNLKATDTLTLDGKVDASSQLRQAGSVIVEGDQVVVGGNIGATGFTGGGSIKIGGDFQGMGDNGIAASSRTVIGSKASFDASAEAGDAGEIIVWSDGDTIFEGEARANATGAIGNGGLLEVSGKENLTYRGLVSASSKSGRAGLVLFDPGTLRVGNGLSGTNTIANATINDLLQAGTSVLLTTQGTTSDIIFVDTGVDDDRHDAIQWTNSNASFGAFAGRDIFVNTHIRTSGAGSINLIAGWTGTEANARSLLTGTTSNIFSPRGAATLNTAGGTGTRSVQSVFNQYLSSGQFGGNNGDVIIGSATMTRHVEVGSRYGDTNIAGFNIDVTASETATAGRWAQIGFHDSGQVFAPLMGSVNRILDLNTFTADNALNANNPVVGIAGNDFGQERGDGHGVYAINAEGVHRGDNTLSSGTNATFIPYANHYMSAQSGNWWWQQIDRDSKLTDLTYNPNDLGGNRPEMGAGQLTNTADINVIAAGNVTVQAGLFNNNGAFIGHGGDSAMALNQRAVNLANQRWSQNGANNDRSAMAIARLAPVYGNINVLAGVTPNAGVTIDSNGVNALFADGTGSVVVSGHQRLGLTDLPDDDETDNTTPATGSPASAPALIGHGGPGQFGEFNGDIKVQAGANVQVLAGSNSRSYAQIGHNIDSFHYWDPPSNADAQIRFFANNGDFLDPLLRRGELFTGQTNIAQGQSAGVTSAGETIRGNTNGAFSDPRIGAVAIEALEGSVVTGFHGNVTVAAEAGDVTLQGYNTEDQSAATGSNLSTNGLATNRERRYAKIGHGGTSLVTGLPNGSVNNGNYLQLEHSGYSVNPAIIALDKGNPGEDIQYRIPLDGTETGSPSIIGAGTMNIDRRLTFMTITGDVSVRAFGDVSAEAGNDVYDFAQIGHGGNELADYETSSFIAGNISINAGGELIITGGGEVKWTGDGANRHMRSQAHVGHGGYQTGFLGYFGDIDVTTGGNITVTGGAYGDTYAKIGHMGSNDWGQIGGNFARTENFLFDGVSIDLASSISGNTGVVTYSSGSQASVPSSKGVSELSGTLSRTFNLTSSTTDVSVTSTGGTITLAHLDAQTMVNENQSAQGRQIDDSQMRNSYAQIGHGGSNTALLYSVNSRTNFDDIIGNITVNAPSLAGDLILEGGNREGMWSRVGHGFTGTNVGVAFGEELLIGGEIRVNVGRDVTLDGLKGGELDINDDPARDNGLAIGHGTFVLGNGGSQLAVLDGGTINGLTVASTITVNAGNDITIQGGNGAQELSSGEVTPQPTIGASGTHSQIGHGTTSLGQSVSTRGFAGDINVSADGDIVLRASSNGIVSAVLPASGGAAIIGNGGIHMAAPASGNINVYAGGNLDIISPKRNGVDIENPSDLRAANYTHLQFAKIGHFSTENNLTGTVNVGQMNGDISVVVGNNLTMTGGQTPGHSSVNFNDATNPGRQGVTAAFVQIGHGGPGINENLSGNIEVLVKNNLTTNDGTIDAARISLTSANNYVKIGHGDWMREGTRGFVAGSTGVMTGDIAVLVGESASLENTLIGHRDPALAGVSTAGSTYLAVSRNFPFYSGTGTLTATGSIQQNETIGALAGTGVVPGSVLTSGNGGQLSIYMPERDSNLLAVDSTRLNTNNIFYHGNNGGGLPTGTGSFAGAADEVFLAPDLWWMNPSQVAQGNARFLSTGVFPTSANGSQGGVVAEVSDPGGLPNLETLTAGALGTSPNGSDYRSHTLSGGLYTLFYDAIEPVANTFPPGIPSFPPIFAPVLDNIPPVEIFESFQRHQEGFDGILGGSGFEGDLPYRNQFNDQLGIPNWFLEEMLDMMAGPRQSGKSEANGAIQTVSTSVDDEGVIRTSSSAIQSENEEELRRRSDRNSRVGRVGTISYLIYTPGSGNPYSSLNLFGQPQ